LQHGQRHIAVGIVIMGPVHYLHATNAKLAGNCEARSALMFQNINRVRRPLGQG